MGRSSKKFVAVWSVAIFATMLFGAQRARAQHTYQWDNGNATEFFNNSQGDETEDNWVGNAFQVVAGGTHLVSISLGIGDTLTNEPTWVLFYRGADINDPCAGGGLQEIYRQQTTVTGVRGQLVTITLDTPIDLQEGDVFYAAVLMRNIPGTLFPFIDDQTAILNHSFFDTGPAQGAPYDLDTQSWRYTVFGGIHPVVGFAQDAGSLVLRVNATGGMDIAE